MAEKKITEKKVAKIPSSPKTLPVFTDLSCKEFGIQLASKAPVPGGGGASALVAALGAALCNMVGNLTIGKKKYAAVEDEISGLMEKVDRLQTELMDLVEQDAKSFEPLSQAYKLPTSTPEEIAEKEKVMESCLKVASEAPLQIMRKICRIIAMISVFANKGSVYAVSDAGTAAAICSAALRGASLNVYINTGMMKDREYAENLNQDVDEMLDIFCSLADNIYADVFHTLRHKED